MNVRSRQTSRNKLLTSLFAGLLVIGYGISAKAERVEVIDDVSAQINYNTVKASQLVTNTIDKKNPPQYVQIGEKRIALSFEKISDVTTYGPLGASDIFVSVSARYKMSETCKLNILNAISKVMENLRNDFPAIINGTRKLSLQFNMVWEDGKSENIRYNVVKKKETTSFTDTLDKIISRLEFPRVFRGR